jgi:hypothetical protein
MAAPEAIRGLVVQQQQLVRYAITGIIIVLVMALRFRNVGKMRRLRLETLWVVPAVYLAIVVATFVSLPPVGVAWAYIAAALITGAAFGWQRGKTMHIEVDPATHALNQRTSPAALAFIVVIILARSGVRALVQQGGLHVNVMTVTDILMAFALGMFATQRVEMYLRAKRLLEEARAAAPQRR